MLLFTSKHQGAICLLVNKLSHFLLFCIKTLQKFAISIFFSYLKQKCINMQQGSVQLNIDKLLHCAKKNRQSIFPAGIN